MRRKSDFLKRAKRLVLKIGTGVLLEGNHRIHFKRLEELTACVSQLCKSGYEVLFVSSGAIAFGMLHLGLKERPKAISQKQACAAIGQSHLIHHYEGLFAKSDIKVAQVLLSRDDLENKDRYANAKHTFEQLLQWKVLPIVNENDSVAVEEIKIGDNDNLSAFVASAVEAHLLVILSHVDGVFSADPKKDPQARLIPELEGGALAQLSGISGDAESDLNTGGMATKIEAARMAGKAGIPTVIINGTAPKNLLRLLKGEAIGTFIFP
jgi:glutamate 5-kinase